MHLDSTQLDKVDDLGASAICVLHWDPASVADWTQNWAPTDLRSGKPASPAVSISNPAVAAALSELTDTTASVGQKADRVAAIVMFLGTNFALISRCEG